MLEGPQGAHAIPPAHAVHRTGPARSPRADPPAANGLGIQKDPQGAIPPLRALGPGPRTAPGPHKDKKAPAQRATPIKPPHRTMPQDAERPAGEPPPRAPPGACGARGARGTRAYKKSALRERDALPSRSLALQYSRRRRAYLPGSGWDRVIPASVVALAGGAPPRLSVWSLPGPLIRGDPGGRMAGTDRRWRIALGACHRGCEELGLLVPLG